MWFATIRSLRVSHRCLRPFFFFFFFFRVLGNMGETTKQKRGYVNSIYSLCMYIIIIIFVVIRHSSTAVVYVVWHSHPTTSEIARMTVWACCMSHGLKRWNAISFIVEHCWKPAQKRMSKKTENGKITHTKNTQTPYKPTTNIFSFPRSVLFFFFTLTVVGLVIVIVLCYVMYV